MPRKRIEINIELAIEMYVKEMMTCHEIAEVLPCSSTTVRIRLKEHGVKMRKRGEWQRAKMQGLLHDLDLKKRIIRHYLEDKMTYKQISDALGNIISSVYIGKLLGDWGVEKRKMQGYQGKRLTDTLPAEEIIRQYLEEELSLMDIANVYETSQGIIAKILENNNVPRRTLSEAKSVVWKRKKESAKQELTSLDTSDIEDMSVEAQIKHLRDTEDAYIQDIVAALNVDPGYVLEVLSR